MSEEQWQVVVMPPARRAFDRLPISVAAAVLETLDAIAENPRRLGKPLMLEHRGVTRLGAGPIGLSTNSRIRSGSYAWSQSAIAATSIADAEATILDRRRRDQP